MAVASSVGEGFYVSAVYSVDSKVVLVVIGLV